MLTWYNTLPILQKEGDEEGEPEPEVDEGGVPSEAEEDEPEEEEPVPENEDGEDEENKPVKQKIMFFKETDYHLRVPHERYLQHKNLESLAMAAPETQPMLKVNILCCGVRYGNGEGAFYDHFKKAWIQSPEFLHVLGKGDNLIPTIHIKDLARATKRIIDDDIKKNYIFCVDKTKRPS